ncbi:MAG: hypothetical protein IT381_12715 [Deltaproteobacteria bacterium]|nr:hypothetical protein [Deltaproteobacteria bacterium]
MLARLVMLLSLSCCAVARADEDPLSDVLTPVLAGLERTTYKRLTPAAFVAGERKDPYHARAYVECGLEAAVDASYGGERVTIFQLSSALAAMCALGNDKTLDGNPIDTFSGPESEAFRSPGWSYLRQGRYFVRIKGSQGNFGGGSRAAALLKAIAFLLPSPKTPDPEIAALRELPAASRIPGSDRYVSKGVLGGRALASGYSAEYGCGEVGVTIINVTPSDRPAKARLAAFAAELQERGLVGEPSMFGDESMVFAASGAPARTYAVRVGELISVVDAEAPIDACGELMTELVSVLRRRQARATAP